MTSFLIDKVSASLRGTSSDSPMGYQERQQTASITVFPSLEKTITNKQTSDWDLRHLLNRTTNGFTISQTDIYSKTTQSALNELRKLSGLTWEQLARLFNVSRRSLHFWASGQPISRFNEETLHRLLGTLQYINRGSAEVNRKILLNSYHKAQIPFDLLVAGRYEDVKNLLGYGNVSKRHQLMPLSEEESTLRKPHKPDELVDALQDPVHHNVGRSHSIRAARSSKRDRKS
ncbi:MAG: helix-turn-helix transcriptional regulator [Symploca sp. SIO1B1]|nr:helix-turn-helix transcriptional regulator [Symploca sp. SIO1C2]NER97061.1 helix-turn-helix transcriptional regulator [Symploca sp. SIO1B1]